MDKGWMSPSNSILRDKEALGGHPLYQSFSEWHYSSANEYRIRLTCTFKQCLMTWENRGKSLVWITLNHRHLTENQIRHQLNCYENFHLKGELCRIYLCTSSDTSVNDFNISKPRWKYYNYWEIEISSPNLRGSFYNS